MDDVSDYVLLDELFDATAEGNVGEVTRMLDAIPSLLEDTEQMGGELLQVLAAQLGHAAVVRLLVQRGADVNARNFCGISALEAAAEGGHEEIVSFLLSRGADTGTAFGGLSALQLASIGRDAGTVRVLLKHMMERRGDGEPFVPQMPRRAGSVEVGRAFLLAGADHTVTHDGLTPKQGARKDGRGELVALFEVRVLSAGGGSVVIMLEIPTSDAWHKGTRITT
jgi:hypothetical protein